MWMWGVISPWEQWLSNALVVTNPTYSEVKPYIKSRQALRKVPAGQHWLCEARGKSSVGLSSQEHLGIRNGYGWKRIWD